jgi:superfamily II DNA or RNA helicase
MTFEIGSSVTLPSGQPARIIALASLFGQEYADAFIEPAGPVQRILLSELHPRSDPLADLAQGRGEPAPLFFARLIAQALQSTLTQPGVLSAANFRITPLPHQVLAVDFMLGQFKPRAMIADEVGLGKTIEAAMIFEELKLRRQARRVLIITPAGLTRQWQDELTTKFSEQFMIMDRNMFAALGEMHGKETNLWTQRDQVITSLDFIKPRRIHPELSERERQRREEHNQQVFDNLVHAGWDMVIIDEAHKLSKDEDGTETARYKIGEALSEAVPVFLLLTATPHQGKPNKFMYLLSLVDPYGFTRLEDLKPENVSKVVWRTRKRAAIDAQKNPLFKQRITDIYPVDRSGAEYNLERSLYDKVTDYVSTNYNRALGRNDRAFGFLMILFQRMLTSSTQAITDSLEKRLKMLVNWQEELDESDQPKAKQMDFDEQEAFDEDAQSVADLLIDLPGIINRAELSKEILVLGELVNLAKRALKETDSKVAALLNIVDEIRRREGPQTKFLVFTEFVATQKMLKRTLEELGFKVCLINGSMDLNARTLARQDFAGETQFMLSTDAGGEGVNLQFCHAMVNYDLPWNPMKLEQRIGRLDRIGQAHNVIVLNLIIGETVEQRVRQVLENKLAIIRSQFGEDKLADILSTLQEEFQFDKLYMDAIAKRQAEAVALENIGEQIYQRARQILEQDDLLLPQAQAELYGHEQRMIAIPPERLKAMLSGYLSAQGETLNSYARQPDLYYFDLPVDGGKTRYSDVVFDRQRAVENDSLVFLHLNHPLIREVMAKLTDGAKAPVAQLRLRNPGAGNASEAGSGLLAVYSLGMTSAGRHSQRELIPIFLGSNGQSNPRLARALLELPPESADTAFTSLAPEMLTGLLGQARQAAERLSADRFTAKQLAHAEQIDREREKLEQYYRKQEKAVRMIGIENIRQAKEHELFERRRADLDALNLSANLVPDLQLVGLAWVVT